MNDYYYCLQIWSHNIIVINDGIESNKNEINCWKKILLYSLISSFFSVVNWLFVLFVLCTFDKYIDKIENNKNYTDGKLRSGKKH